MSGFVSLHQEMMFNFFAGCVSDKHFTRAVEILLNGQVNLYDDDNQLFRELHVKRWEDDKCKIVYNAIMKVTGMDMPAIRTLIAKMYNLSSWHE